MKGSNISSYKDSLGKNIYLEDLYIEYRKEYFGEKNFLDLNLKNVNKKNFQFTIDTSKGNKIINSYGHPIEFDFKELEYISLKKIFKEIVLASKENGIKKIFIKKRISEKSLDNFKKTKNKTLISCYKESILMLDQDLDAIKKNFKKGHKSSLKTNYDNLTYEIIDYKNYPNNEILQMMKLHKKVAGHVTRSEKSWKINEQMILGKKGFLIKVTENKKPISYAFFFHNKFFSLYFSACTIREKFKIYKNISHKTIWLAIQHLKKIGCKQFLMGNVKTIFSVNKFDSKTKNIELFKSSFGGDKNFYVEYYLKVL